MAIRDQFRPFQSRLCPVWVYFGSILGLFWVYFRSILGVTHGRFTPSESVTHGRFTPPAGVTHGRFIHQKVRPPSAKLPTYLSYLHATLGLPTPRLTAFLSVPTDLQGRWISLIFNSARHKRGTAAPASACSLLLVHESAERPAAAW